MQVPSFPQQAEIGQPLVHLVNEDTAIVNASIRHLGPPPLVARGNSGCSGRSSFGEPR
jgi:hypothetical protein